MATILLQPDVVLESEAPFDSDATPEFELPLELESLAELLHRLGDVPLERVLARPAPGTATPADVLRLCDGEPKRLCELVDGVLVEKARGQRESRIGISLACALGNYLNQNNLGVLTGADGPHHLSESQVRFPDISFIPWSHIPPDAAPNTPVPDWVPGLAVEVISPGNTRGEMARKLHDYFAAGVALVWYVYPRDGVVRAYTSETEFQTLNEADQLDGGAVLPGFRYPIRQLFAAGSLKRPDV